MTSLVRWRVAIHYDHGPCLVKGGMYGSKSEQYADHALTVLLHDIYAYWVLQQLL